MEKITALFAALVLLITLCACGSTAPATNDSPEAPMPAAEAVAETPTPAPVKSEKEQALDMARWYLADSEGIVFYSHDGMIKLMEINGFSHDAAVYAADNCGADWYEMVWGELNAHWSAENFYPQDAISNLQLRGFSYDEAIYAVTKFCDDNGIRMDGPTEEERAVEIVQLLLEAGNGVTYWSRDGMIKQLEIDNKFSHDAAAFAVDSVGIDWNEQAAGAARTYITLNPGNTRETYISNMELQGFTHDQAVYAVDLYF